MLDLFAAGDEDECNLNDVRRPRFGPLRRGDDTLKEGLKERTVLRDNIRISRETMEGEIMNGRSVCGVWRR